MRSRRAGHEKSRNGCLTCKIRRVKCDETSPHCRKCIESGRQCEGPIVPRFRFVEDKSLNVSVVRTLQPERTFFKPQYPDDERRAFHFYMRRVTPVLADGIDASFWLSLVPQLAQTYGFVWDTVVCLGILHEHVPYMSLTSTFESDVVLKVLNEQHRRALKLYNRAIMDVRRQAQHAQPNDFVVALSFILFASVEFQQRNVKSGNDLMKRCCRLLNTSFFSPQNERSTASVQAVHQVFTPFVLRRAITIATLGNGPSPRPIADPEINSMLNSFLTKYPALNRARVDLQQLIFESFELLRLADFLHTIKDDNPDKIIFMSLRQMLLDRLGSWKAIFMSETSEVSGEEISWMESYLFMYWAVCYTSLAACVSPFELIYDDYLDRFAEIIKHAKICLASSTDPKISQLLSNLDPGIIPPLYFCATKCRHPLLRREAVQLMRDVPTQKNEWAFVTPERVAAKVISVEERNEHTSCSNHSLNSNHTGLPPEQCRYPYISVISRQTYGGKRRLALEMGKFPFTSDGTRKLVNDYVWLDE